LSKDIASEPAGSDAGVEDRVLPEPEVAEPGCTDSVATKRGSQTRNALS